MLTNPVRETEPSAASVELDHAIRVVAPIADDPADIGRIDAGWSQAFRISDETLTRAHFDTAPLDIVALDVLPIDQTVSRKALPVEYDELAEWDAIMAATALNFHPARANQRPTDSVRWSLASEIALALIAVIVTALVLAAVLTGVGLNWIPVAVPILAVVVVRGALAFKRWILEATPRGTRANVAVAAITSTIVTTALMVLICVVGIRSIQS